MYSLPNLASSFPVNLLQPFSPPDPALLIVDDTLWHYIKGGGTSQYWNFLKRYLKRQNVNYETAY
jgi:hypothetical protein